MSFHIAPNPHATFVSTQDQVIANPTLAQVVTFNTTINANGITLAGGTKVTLPQIGNYSFAVSAVVDNPGQASAKKASMWFRKNDVDVPYSNTYLSVGKDNPTVLAVVFNLECTTVGDYYELWWSGEVNTVQLDAFAAVPGTVPATFPPAQPASPSIVLAVCQIG